MKKIIPILALLSVLGACNQQEKGPDVSGEKVNLTVRRFDQDFFAIDTLQLSGTMTALAKKYPSFLTIFLERIAAVSSAEGIVSFYHSYKPFYDSAQRIYKSFEPERAGIEKALKYVKHYFPTYIPPAAVMPILGPLQSRDDFARMKNGDYTPNFLGEDYIGVSLQFYLGSNFIPYQDEEFVNKVAPLYRSRRFSKEYIIPEVMKLVADEVYPDESNTQSLINQMIEKGKQWWLLDKFLPETPDSLKTGFTAEQVEWCKENEGLIWSYILKNENLYAIDPATIQIYIGEGPFTQGFSDEASPGNIGQWIGWQIVKKYVAGHDKLTPAQVVKVSAKEILEEAKYKPK